MIPSLTTVRWIVVFAIGSLGLVFESEARPFRPARIPNGTVFSCSNCHLNPAGGGARTPFGQAVFVKIGGTSADVAFWDAVLADMDSDGDDVKNGEELGDPDGDFLNIGPAALVSNPGNANSVPPDPNSAPEITSTPITTAFIGEAYSYPITASDVDGNTLTYRIESGPEWLSINRSGVVSGTPPEGTPGEVAVALSVTDNGFPQLSAEQNYNITLLASFIGFQNLNFDLPTEAAIAAPDQDPDEDKLPNAAEFALKTDPRVPDDLLVPPEPTFDGEGRMQFSLQIRDDLSGMDVRLEAFGEIPFLNADVIDPVITDPDDADGFQTWTFTDTGSKDVFSSRFGQLRFELVP